MPERHPLTVGEEVFVTNHFFTKGIVKATVQNVSFPCGSIIWSTSDGWTGKTLINDWFFTRKEAIERSLALIDKKHLELTQEAQRLHDLKLALLSELYSE